MNKISWKTSVVGIILIVAGLYTGINGMVKETYK